MDSVLDFLDSLTTKGDINWWNFCIFVQLNRHSYSKVSKEGIILDARSRILRYTWTAKIRRYSRKIALNLKDNVNQCFKTPDTIIKGFVTGKCFTGGELPRSQTPLSLRKWRARKGGREGERMRDVVSPLFFLLPVIPRCSSPVSRASSSLASPSLRPNRSTWGGGRAGNRWLYLPCTCFCGCSMAVSTLLPAIQYFNVLIYSILARFFVGK